MATRLQLRTALEDKILSVEDSGYGDFEYDDSQLNGFLSLSVARLYPALYKKVASLAQTPTSYGTNGFKRLAVNYEDRVFLVISTTEQDPIFGWRMIPGYISNLDLPTTSGTVDVYYTDAYALAADDVTDLGAPALWTPLIVLGALIEALESRQDSGVRGDPAPVGNNVEVPLLDRLIQRYETMRADLEMALPGLMC